ncbi:hypothetical protein BTJ40_12945 [Microbulbifer sp. A4B17]|nr:hypothetical protein BTJ40_12945 [Microbulbifer sp. A4B17]
MPAFLFNAYIDQLAMVEEGFGSVSDYLYLIILHFPGSLQLIHRSQVFGFYQFGVLEAARWPPTDSQAVSENAIGGSLAK